MITRLLRFLTGLVALAGAIGALRQRAEARAVRRGEIPAASAAADIEPRRADGPAAARLAAWVPSRPRTRAGRALATVWSAPLTICGLLLAGLSGRRPTWDPELGCLVVTGAGGPSRLALRAVGAHANTIGQVIIATQETPSRVLLAHEATHARQAERLGPLLFPLYVLLGARYGYRDNPLERAARSGARRHRDGAPGATGQDADDSD